MVPVPAGSLALPLIQSQPCDLGWSFTSGQHNDTTTPLLPPVCPCGKESVPAHLHVPPPPPPQAGHAPLPQAPVSLTSTAFLTALPVTVMTRVRPDPSPTSRCLMDTQSARAVSADLMECVMSTVRPASGQLVVWWLVLYPARGIQSTRQRSGAVRKSTWTSWAPVPNKPTVSVDVKQHFNSPLEKIGPIGLSFSVCFSNDMCPAYPPPPPRPIPPRPIPTPWFSTC